MPVTLLSEAFLLDVTKGIPHRFTEGETEAP